MSHHQSSHQSAEHSQHSSRITSPASYPVLLYKRKEMEEKERKKKFLKISLVVLSIFLSFALSQLKFSYCTSPYSIFCTPCPKHARCSRNDFKCEDPYHKISKGCYNTTTSEHEIQQLSDEVYNSILANNIWSFSKLKKQFPNTKRQDLKAALRYNGNFRLIFHIIFPDALIPKEYSYLIIGSILPTIFFVIFLYKI